MPNNKSMKLIKNVQNVTSLVHVANKKQETPVMSYLYLHFHCITSCS